MCCNGCLDEFVDYYSYEQFNCEEDKVEILCSEDEKSYGMKVEGCEVILGKEKPPKSLNTFFSPVDKTEVEILRIEKSSISFSEVGRYFLEYKGNRLCEDEVEKDLEKLSKFSFCFQQDDDTYFFPEIKLVIWNGGSYSIVSVYEYGSYDGILSEEECSIINNVKKCENYFVNF